MVSQASLLVAVGLIATALGGVALAFSGGFLPGTAGGETPAPVSNESVESDLNATNASFQYVVDSVDECGLTCRNATGTLTNNGSEPANNITIRTRLYADDDLLWKGSTDVGGLDSGESHTDSMQIELGFSNGQKAKSNGQVTIETIISFDEGTDVFRAVRKVD